MEGLRVSTHYHVTQLSSGGGSSSGTVGPLFIVLAIIMVLGVIAGFIGRVCSGRHWGGDTQYDFEGWVEKRCASCIDGDIEAPPPPPPPPEKPPEPAAPPPELPPPAAADAPPPADAAPAPADAPPPAADAAPAPDPPAEAPAEPPAAEAPAAPAEAAAPPPSEPLPPPPPPPPPPEEASGAAAAYAGLRTEPLTYRQFYPSYSCNCHICAREGIFE